MNTGDAAGTMSTKNMATVKKRVMAMVKREAMTSMAMVDSWAAHRR